MIRNSSLLRPIFSIGTVVLVSISSAHAHDGHEGDAHAHSQGAAPRIWVNTTTGEAVQGTLLAVSGQLVSIQCEDGEVVRLMLDDLGESDRGVVKRRYAQIRDINQRPELANTQEAGGPDAASRPAPLAPRRAEGRPRQASIFELFAPFVKTRWDERWLYVESDGLPHAPVAHPMMIGIRAWQQQVPLPQPYSGANAWRIPLSPELAETPVSAKEQLFRGAIALAANGIPIFNPIKNDGRTDTFLAGELDEFGGHCGRADDYHYHIAPLALQKAVGRGEPIAYALDGYAIYGLCDPQAKPGSEACCPLGSREKLDELNGHHAPPAEGHKSGGKGSYHYHASTAYPYVNGGMRGKVVVRDGQIDPQPRARPVREWLQPLRGAEITGFKKTGDASWSLEYTLSGRKYRVEYRIEGKGDDAKVIFEFVSPDGTKKTSQYDVRDDQPAPSRPNEQRQPGERRDRPRRPRGERTDQNPDRTDRPRQREDTPRRESREKPDSAGMKLLSPAIGPDGTLPIECTCDGAGISPPLTWNQVPKGTQCFAATMHHIPRPRRDRDADRPSEDKHVYLVLFGIPGDALQIEKGRPKFGTFGVNTVNRRAEYAPPCSQGPGVKKYTITLYALSSQPTLPSTDGAARAVTMDDLLAAIKDCTLATSTLDVTYERKGDGR